MGENYIFGFWNHHILIPCNSFPFHSLPKNFSKTPCTNYVLHIGLGLSEPILGYTFFLLCITRVHNTLKHFNTTLWFTTDTVLLPYCAVVVDSWKKQCILNFGNIYLGLYGRKFKRRLVNKSKAIAASSDHVLPVIKKPYLNHGLNFLKQIIN